MDGLKRKAEVQALRVKRIDVNGSAAPEGAPPMDDRYINRELSWLAFNRRVLAQADSARTPEMERLRFLAITASNLDEFFMIRYASLRVRALGAGKWKDPSGLTAAEQMRLVGEDAGRFMDEQMQVFAARGLPVLRAVGLHPLPADALTEPQKTWAGGYFSRFILPRLKAQPLKEEQHAVGIAGRALHMALFIEGKKGLSLASVCLPPDLKRVCPLPRALGDGMLLLEDIIALFARQLMPEAQLLGCYPFRVTRDEDFTIEDDDTAHDLLLETRESLKRRKTGDIVRLEVGDDMPDACVQKLLGALRMEGGQAYAVQGPIDLVFLQREIVSQKDLDAPRYPAFQSQTPWPDGEEKVSVLHRMRAGDIFLHHPYNSFDTVLQFVREAAADPRVLAIKQTLYRVSGNSPVIRTLCEAAEAGKHVTVLLELKARFDEENNMRWGEVLKHAGCEVIYGLPRLKTHSKITLVVRRERHGLRRYLHLGTGNYNDETARLYTDMGLLTCDPMLGEDAQSFFNMITGFSQEPSMRKLVYAPHMLRGELTEMINTEADNARAGKPSGIFAKMNSLVDPGIIQSLYDASEAGVPVRLIVRGICCLRPGVTPFSETIQVRSLIGRFLEHSRAFCFENGGAPRVFLSSADWMPRNLDRRVELMFPVEDESARERIRAALDLQWSDTVGCWEMRADAAYARITGDTPIDAQSALAFSEKPKEKKGTSKTEMQDSQK